MSYQWWTHASSQSRYFQLGVKHAPEAGGGSLPVMGHLLGGLVHSARNMKESAATMVLKSCGQGEGLRRCEWTELKSLEGGHRRRQGGDMRRCAEMRGDAGRCGEMRPTWKKIILSSMLTYCLERVWWRSMCMANCGTEAKMMTFETMIAGVDQNVVSSPWLCKVADQLVSVTRGVTRDEHAGR